MVIGNADYEMGLLRNPVNDAQAMARTLKELGFTVISGTNQSWREMRKAIVRFGRELDKGGLGLFYYAGHGIQVDGQNYLIPIGAQIKHEEEVPAEAVGLRHLMSRMAGARNHLNIIILDACRNNPFEHRFHSGGKAGLAQVKAPKGSIIAYSTAPGQTAADGSGEHSVFTQTILDHIKTPGLSLLQLFNRVGRVVDQASGGSQRPWFSRDYYDQVFLSPNVEPSHTVGGSHTQENRPSATESATVPPAASALNMNLLDILGVDTHPSKLFDSLDKKITSQNLPEIRVLAEQGHPQAQGLLGRVFYKGMIVPKNYQKALTWCSKAADRGFTLAQNLLGVLYQHGLGVNKDYSRAVEWYRRAADQGFAAAQANLGFMYSYGRGKDYSLAVEWYRRAAEQGLAYGQYYLGVSYHYGQGVNKDYSQAVVWYSKAAEQGDANAQNNLGVMYYYGRGVEKDYSQAANWYRKAAKQGHANAQNNLARCITMARVLTKTIPRQFPGTAMRLNKDMPMLKTTWVGCIEKAVVLTKIMPRPSSGFAKRLIRKMPLLKTTWV